MEEELLNIVYDYSIQNKLLDQNAINKIVEIVVTYKDLAKYLRDIRFYLPPCQFNNTQNNVYALYDSFDKFLYVELKNFYQHIFESRKMPCFYGAEQILSENLEIFRIILHELEHLNQEKIMITKNNLEAKILRCRNYNASSKLYIKLINSKINETVFNCYVKNPKTISKNYRVNYKIAPDERLANIKAYQTIIIMLINIKDKYPHLLNYEIIEKLKVLLTGFEIDHDTQLVLSPTITYLKQNGNPSILNHLNFNWYSKNPSRCLVLSKKHYSLDDRLKYGLMIDKEELETCKKELDSFKI